MPYFLFISYVFMNLQEPNDFRVVIFTLSKFLYFWRYIIHDKSLQLSILLGRVIVKGVLDVNIYELRGKKIVLFLWSGTQFAKFVRMTIYTVTLTLIAYFIHSSTRNRFSSRNVKGIVKKIRVLHLLYQLSNLEEMKCTSIYIFAS